jgi:hypothetical protein
MDYNKKKLLCAEIDNGNILVFKYEINVLDEPEEFTTSTVVGIHFIYNIPLVACHYHIHLR